jgi:hypothetical protein
VLLKNGVKGPSIKAPQITLGAMLG